MLIITNYSKNISLGGGGWFGKYADQINWKVGKCLACRQIGNKGYGICFANGVCLASPGNECRVKFPLYFCSLLKGMIVINTMPSIVEKSILKPFNQSCNFGLLISNKTKMVKEKKVERYRDAGDGQYVSKEYAEKHPKTTVKETDKVPAKSNPKRK